jgi:hypothetical protein
MTTVRRNIRAENGMTATGQSSAFVDRLRIGRSAPKAVSRMMLSNRTRQVLDTDAWTALQLRWRARNSRGRGAHQCQLIRRKADISGETGIERRASPKLAPSLVVFEPHLYAGTPPAEPMDATHACGTPA